MHLPVCLWDMSEAYANAKFQSHMLLPEINEKLKDEEGHLYGFAPTYGNGCVTYVKQAWLDAVGLKAEDIKTYDDYYNMLLKFHNEDPDGDGVTGNTYGVIAAGFVGNEAPYVTICLSSGRMLIPQSCRMTTVPGTMDSRPMLPRQLC